MLAQGVRSLLGVVDVLHHHRGARQADLALLSVGHLDLGAGHDNLVVGVREGDADGTLAGQSRRSQAACGDALGGAIALAHLDGGLVILQEGVDALLQLDRQGIAAGEHALETTQIQIVQAVQTQQRLVQRGHAGNEVRLVLAQQLRVGLGREARHQHAAAAVDQHGVDAHAQAEAVEHGHDGQHLVADGVDRVGGDDLRAQGVEVEVGEQDALGHAGGSAAVEDDGGLRACALHAGIAGEALSVGNELLPGDVVAVLGELGHLLALGQRVAQLHHRVQRVLDAGDDQRFERGGILTDVGEFAVELIQRQRGHGFGVVQIELDLALSGQRMDHVGDGAHHVDGVEHGHRLRTVGHGDGHAVVLLHAGGAQRPGALVNRRHTGAVIGVAAHEVIGDDVGIFVRDALHGLAHAALEVVQLRGNAVHEGHPRGLYFLRLRENHNTTSSLAGRSRSSGCSMMCLNSAMLRA